MPSSAQRRGCVLAVALALAAAPAAADAGRSVDYLHIAANEGGSSGGHVALRLGGWIYHFQHDRGLLRMQRDAWPRFDYRYRTLQNRGIDVSRVPVSEETWHLLERAFQRRYLAQERRLALLGALRRDAALLAALLAQASGEADGRGFAVHGAGFFAAPGEAAAAPQAIRRLRARIAALHGDDFLASRRRDLEASLVSFDPTPIDPAAIELAPERYPTGPEPFSRRYAEHLSALLALDLLERPAPLETRALGRQRLELDADESRRLEALSHALTGSMARLVASPRPDWGYPLILGMARLAALERSRAMGQLVLLDSFPAGAHELELGARRRAALPDVLVEAEGDLREARERALADDGWREADWSALELAASRVDEIERGLAGAPALRIVDGAVLPEGLAPVSRLPAVRGDDAQLARSLEAATDGARRYRAALEQRYGYDLLSRNCVSEIFRTIDSAFAEGASELVEEEARLRLGGHVEPVANLNFIPFVSARRVRARYRVAERLELPSYRHFHVRAMAEREPALWVALRESNTFTSRVYRRGGEDGFFVFFTDRAPLLRPLLGAANAVGAVGWSVGGLALFPVDRGRTLRSGLEGLLFSLPELGFVNLRKGSNDYVPPELRPPPG